MLHMTTLRWRLFPSQQFSASLHLHLTITALNKETTPARTVCCCIDPYVLAHFRPSLPVFVSTLSHNFCTVQAWMCPQASLVNVPSHTTLISGLVCFCSKPPQPGNSVTFLSCLSPHQTKWVLINSSWLLPSPCLLHWFTFFFLFFSCSSRLQVAALVLCTHLHRSLSINPGRSLSSLNRPSSFSFLPFHSFLFLSLILLLCLSYPFCLPLSNLPSLQHHRHSDCHFNSLCFTLSLLFLLSLSLSGNIWAVWRQVIV